MLSWYEKYHLLNVYFSEILLECMSNYYCYEKSHSFHYPVFFAISLHSGRSRPSDKGGGGGGHPDPEIRGGPGLQKIFFAPSGLILVKK